MYPVRIVFFLIFGLCVIQGLHASLLGDIVRDAVDEIEHVVHKLEEEINKFKSKIQNEINHLKEDFNNLPKCRESEKPKISALVNKIEQGALAFGIRVMTNAGPIIMKMVEVMKGVVPLTKSAIAEIKSCDTENHNIIKRPICKLRVVVSLINQIKNITDEVKALVPVLQQVYHNQVIPLIKLYFNLLLGDVKRAKTLIVEFGNCVVSNKQLDMLLSHYVHKQKFVTDISP